MPEMPELYMHRIGRTRSCRCNWNCNPYSSREEEFKVEVEVLMNMELAIESFQKQWKFHQN
jgi:ATP-dependent RNA helicase RhlE